MPKKEKGCHLEGSFIPGGGPFLQDRKKGRYRLITDGISGRRGVSTLQTGLQEGAAQPLEIRFCMSSQTLSSAAMVF